MKRNKNIDILRAFSIILIVVYHIYAISSVKFEFNIINKFLDYSGEIGVTLFFIISGYGIYCYLKNNEGKISYKSFIVSRLKRLLPQYYFCLLIILFFTNASIYLQKAHFLNLFSHFFLFHNLFIETHGSLNGALWSLGVIFQFYLLALVLYKCLEKKPSLTLIFSIFFSIICKYFIFNYIIAPANVSNESYYYFVYGRQIFTCIDNFIIGMFIAKIITSATIDITLKLKRLVYIFISVFLISFWILATSDKYNISLFLDSIYSNSILGYIWHSILAILLGIFIFNFAKIKFYSNPISSLFLKIAKHEYGIYIWHLVLINNLLANSTYMQNLQTNNNLFIYIIILALSIFVGIVMSKIIDNGISETFIQWFIKIIRFLLIFSIALGTVYVVYKSLILLPSVNKNINIIKDNNITTNTAPYNIAQKALSVFDSDKYHKYIYIDTEETGYLYFYHIRYYLSPNQTMHYNKYVYNINYTPANELFIFLKNLDVDYYIIRENAVLENELNITLDKNNATIFSKNDEATNLKDLLVLEK